MKLRISLRYGNHGDSIIRSHDLLQVTAMIHALGRQVTKVNVVACTLAKVVTIGTEERL